MSDNPFTPIAVALLREQKRKQKINAMMADAVREAYQEVYGTPLSHLPADAIIRITGIMGQPQRKPDLAVRSTIKPDIWVPRHPVSRFVFEKPGGLPGIIEGLPEGAITDWELVKHLSD